MLSKKIKILLFNKIRVFEDEIGSLEREINSLQLNNDNSWIVLDIELNKKRNELSSQVKESINDLYDQSLKENYFFFDCPLKVYKNTYKERLNFFLKEIIDGEEKDFIELELIKLLKPQENRFVYYATFKANYHNFIKSDNNYKITNKKKIEYLQKLLKTLGWKYSVNIDLLKNSKDKSKETNISPIIFKKIKQKKKSNYYEENRDLFIDNSKTNSELNNKLQKKFIDLLNQGFIYLKEPPSIFITKDECDRKFQITIATISSIGRRMENEIDDNLLLLTEKKCEIYLTEFLNKSNFVRKKILERKEKLDSSNPDSILLRKELENREDIKNVLVLLNEFQIKAVDELISLLKIKIYYYKGKDISNSKKKNQLTNNQTVILLDKLSFFTHPKIEDLPKLKQAYLISRLTGLNEKNINKHLVELGKKNDDLPENYHNDLKIIDDLLDNLE